MEERNNILIQKFHQNRLEAAEKDELEMKIEQGDISLEELDLFQDVLQATSNDPILLPSARMDHRFYAHLDQLNRKQGWPIKLIGKIAAAILILLAAFLGGRETGTRQEKVPQLSPSQQTLQALLSTKDISEKIHLVSSISLQNDADAVLIDALLYTLCHDESKNVRLACIHALLAYSTLPEVRTGLIHAIQFQESSLILLHLAEAINTSGKKMSKEAFHSHINKSLPIFVQRKLEAVLTHL
ncbi:MAG: HEAT repeat domain-containing protein [Bacteroidota bacterium]